MSRVCWSTMTNKSRSDLQGHHVNKTGTPGSRGCFKLAKKGAFPYFSEAKNASLKVGGCT